MSGAYEILVPDFSSTGHLRHQKLGCAAKYCTGAFEFFCVFPGRQQLPTKRRACRDHAELFAKKHGLTVANSKRGGTIMEEQKAIVRNAGNGRDVELTATQPGQLPDLQQGLTVWAEKRLALAIAEENDSILAVDAAAKGGFEAAPLERLAQAAKKRRDYYDKIFRALQAGYVLMPTLDAELFAVRTDRKKPPAKLYKFHLSSVPDVEARALPAGEGRYVDNNPLVRESSVPHVRTTGSSGETVRELVQAFTASGMDEEIVFPLAMAKPEIIQATSRAMALKVFDEMGLLPATAQSDPVIVGRIVRPGLPAWRRRVTSFLIAWHVDTREI